MWDDTIAAIASPPGPGFRGIVRVSGSESWAIALAGFTSDDEDGHPTRAAVRTGRLKVAGLRPEMPASIALWPGPRTYTGQDLAEIHTVGAVPIVNLVLAQCLHRGARHAEPGEFTLRAFLSGRIDLTRAEAVLGVIDARNRPQLDAALKQLAGGLSGPLLALRDRLLDVLAHLEAGLDFVDERDVDPIGRAALAADLAGSSAEVVALAERLRSRDRPEGQPRVVLVGPPNAGKSRLFNALLGESRALVSTHAGTTRDYLTALLDCEGLTIELIDTAGFESATTPIESQAQALRDDQTALADLRLVCHSGDTAIGPALAVTPHPNPPPQGGRGFSGLGSLQGSSPSPLVGEGRVGGQPGMIDVWTKADLTPPPGPSLLATSAATGAGLDALRAAIAAALRAPEADSDLPASTGARCRDSLLRAGQALGNASESVLLDLGDELVAIDLRQALDELGKVVGATVTDDILDRIFRRFCIGK